MPRPSAHERGYDSRWKRAKDYFLLNNPLCIMCKDKGRTTVATVVDHIIPHRGDKALFWDIATNWMALCASCHSSTKQSIEKRGYDKAIGLDGWPTDPKHPANKV